MKNGLALAVLTRFKWPLSSITLGLVIYLVGFLIALFFNVHHYFLRVWYFYLACFGIFLVSMLWSWGFNSIEKIKEELRSVFSIDETQFNKDAKRLAESISSDKKAFLFSIPGFIFEAYHTWLLWAGRISLPFGEPEIYPGNLVLVLYTAILFSIVMYLVFASVYLMFHGLVFLKKIANFPAKISLLQIKRRVKLVVVNNFILITTIGWFVGVSLVMTILFVYASTIILGFMFFVISFGLFFFFLPQLIFRDSIKQTKENLLRRIESEFSLKARLPLSPDCNIMEALLLCSLFDQVEKMSEWTYETSTLFKLFSSVIIPVVTAFVGIVI